MSNLLPIAVTAINPRCFRAFQRQQKDITEGVPPQNVMDGYAIRYDRSDKPLSKGVNLIV